MAKEKGRMIKMLVDYVDEDQKPEDAIDDFHKGKNTDYLTK